MSADRRMSRKLPRAALLVVLSLSTVGAAWAEATFVLVNGDAAGVGFNDATPATPVDGNPGVTLGEQRQFVFERAAEQWGRLLDSPVQIRIQGSMQSLDGCGTDQVVLGQAGPLGSAANFANAPKPDHSYHIALANSLAGEDLDPDTDDITATFNVSLDSGECLSGTSGWWYGVDDPAVVPSDRIPLLPVVFHELGHGLGFSSQMVNFLGFIISLTEHTPVWKDFIFDQEEGVYWSEMDDLQLADSWTNDPHVTWAGRQTSRYQKVFLGSPIVLEVTAPPAIAGVHTEIQMAEFGDPISPEGLSGEVVLVDDGVAGPSLNDGCEAPFANATDVAGRIALIERGSCNFTVKVANAQAAGAIAALIFNNDATGLPGMGGSDGSIHISSAGITQALGQSIIDASPGVMVRLGPGEGLSGTQNGCVRLFAPNPNQSGSSISHFHSAANPNLLMEPALNRSIFDKVDLTLELFRDIGWSTGRDEALFYDDFDPSLCAPAVD